MARYLNLFQRCCFHFGLFKSEGSLEASGDLFFVVWDFFSHPFGPKMAFGKRRVLLKIYDRKWL